MNVALDRIGKMISHARKKSLKYPLHQTNPTVPVKSGSGILSSRADDVVPESDGTMAISITDTRSFKGRGSIVRQAIRAVVDRLEPDSTKVEELEQGFLVHFPTNLWNWGQRVSLDVKDDGRVTATSTSVASRSLRRCSLSMAQR